MLQSEHFRPVLNKKQVIRFVRSGHLLMGRTGSHFAEMTRQAVCQRGCTSARAVFRGGCMRGGRSLVAIV